MTVAQLIEILQGIPDKSLVVVAGDYHEVESVTTFTRIHYTSADGPRALGPALILD